MNDETETFEQRLRRQPLRQLPHEWRGEILSACSGDSAERRRSKFLNAGFLPKAATPAWLSALRQQLAAFFWPHPRAWAGLAAVWICILALNFSTHEAAPAQAKKSAPPSPEVMVELKKQQRMFAELVGSHETPEADRPKIFSPRPRSERAEVMVT